MRERTRLPKRAALAKSILLCRTAPLLPYSDCFVAGCDGVTVIPVAISIGQKIFRKFGLLQFTRTFSPLLPAWEAAAQYENMDFALRAAASPSSGFAANGRCLATSVAATGRVLPLARRIWATAYSLNPPHKPET